MSAVLGRLGQGMDKWLIKRSGELRRPVAEPVAAAPAAEAVPTEEAAPAPAAPAADVDNSGWDELVKIFSKRH